MGGGRRLQNDISIEESKEEDVEEEVGSMYISLTH